MRRAAPRKTSSTTSSRTRDRLYMLTNADDAEDFALFEATRTTPRRPWRDVIAARARACASRTWMRSPTTSWCTYAEAASPACGCSTWRDGSTRDVALPEAVGTVAASANAEFDTATYRFGYQSLVTPPSVFDEDLDTGERTLLKQQPVLGGYDPPTLRQRARCGRRPHDGTRGADLDRAPRGRRRSTARAPCLLYGYGAYEISDRPVVLGGPADACSTGAVCSPSRTCAAAASSAATGTRTASSRHKPNTLHRLRRLCAEHLVRRPAAPRPTGSPPAAAAPVGC